MKLEVGKYYRTRDGRKVKIITKDSHDTYPFNGDNGHTYTECGNLYWRGTPHGLDIIAEWTDTPEVGTLKEIGAQVGDVVEWIFDSETTATYEVMSIRESMYGMQAHLKGYGGGVFTHQKFRIVSRANQALTGPVRTVTTTRKEIVPGVYGRLTVGDVNGQCVRVEVGRSKVSDLINWWTADELTQAIATLTEIRDALAE